MMSMLDEIQGLKKKCLANAKTILIMGKTMLQYDKVIPALTRKASTQEEAMNSLLEKVFKLEEELLILRKEVENDRQ